MMPRDPIPEVAEIQLGNFTDEMTFRRLSVTQLNHIAIALTMIANRLNGDLTSAVAYAKDVVDGLNPSLDAYAKAGPVQGPKTMLQDMLDEDRVGRRNAKTGKRGGLLGYSNHASCCGALGARKGGDGRCKYCRVL